MDGRACLAHPQSTSGRRYCTATVTAWLFTPPTWIITGISPEGVPLGMSTFTWMMPATKPGAGPEYCTVAVWPPTVAVVFAAAKAPVDTSGLSVPSTDGGIVTPPPVPNNWMTEPAAAGLVELLTLES